MIDILMDIKLLVSANGVNKKTLINNKIYPEAYIYKKYNIDSLQFALSNEYYSYYVEDYEAVYAKIKDSLEGLKKKFKDLKDIEIKKKKKKDSLRLLRKNDTIKRFKVLDSISLLMTKDSAKGLIKRKGIAPYSHLKEEFEEDGTLIKPVSKTDSPQP